jgi:hypothetical protein
LWLLGVGPVQKNWKKRHARTHAPTSTYAYAYTHKRTLARKKVENRTISNPSVIDQKPENEQKKEGGFLFFGLPAFWGRLCGGAARM